MREAAADVAAAAETERVERDRRGCRRSFRSFRSKLKLRFRRIELRYRLRLTTTGGCCPCPDGCCRGDVPEGWTSLKRPSCCRTTCEPWPSAPWGGEFSGEQTPSVEKM